jgi:ribose 5-phosphate isomerase B
MRWIVGADHAGLSLKNYLVEVLRQLGDEVEDLGTHSTDSVDYPDYAAQVARRVADGEGRGLLVCGTGIGMAMAANKVGGVRAAPVMDLESAKLSREHNNANVLALGARVTPPERALDIVRTFLKTAFEGGRHERRLNKIAALEQLPQAQPK